MRSRTRHPSSVVELGAAERTIGFALIRTVYVTVGSLGSLVGHFSEVHGWTAVFGLLALITGVEVVLSTANVALGSKYYPWVG